MLSLFEKWENISLVKRIVCGLIIGTVLGLFLPQAEYISMFGDLFVGALKGIAPLLVFFLVMSSIANHKAKEKTNMGYIVFLYLLGTLSAALLAVFASYIFPVTITLTEAVEGNLPPEGVGEVITTLLLNIVQNPLTSITSGNYIGILAWAVVLGLAFQKTSDSMKQILSNTSTAVSQVVKWVISLAPFGVLGLIFTTISTNGTEIFTEYGKLLAVLVGCMLTMMFIINPIVVFLNIRKNPYPLVFKCLKDSFITAFFTRSSAANIPVNIKLCQALKLNEETYSVSIPLGATINMAGAAITITVMTLATVNTLGYSVDLATVIILSIIASVSACGASGVAGGSLLLIPLACSLFSIPNDIAMQVVAVGFIIGVVQDSFETGLNSSTDAIFTATAEFRQRRKKGEPITW